MTTKTIITARPGTRAGIAAGRLESYASTLSRGRGTGVPADVELPDELAAEWPHHLVQLPGARNGSRRSSRGASTSSNRPAPES